MLDTLSEENNRDWRRGVAARVGQMIKSGQAQLSDSSWVDARFVLLASGLYREVPGRGGVREEYRIELLFASEKLRARDLFGGEIEWISVSQAAQVTGEPRSSLQRMLQRVIAALVFEPDKVRLRDGELVFNADEVSLREDAPVAQRFEVPKFIN